MLKHLVPKRRGASERSIRQSGLSIVELMVGITVGLVVVAGATSLFITNLGNSRRLLVEARLNQDLRAVADIIARDLRRSGYWENSIAGTVTPPASGTAVTNPNPAASSATGSIAYSFARDTATSRCTDGSPCSDNTLQPDDEQFGFKLESGVLKMQLGRSSGQPNWQPLTDPNVVTIDNFVITSNGGAPIAMPSACAASCVAGSCPTLTVRSFTLLLKGTAVSDSQVSRVLRETVRVRNDSASGVCL